MRRQQLSVRRWTLALGAGDVESVGGEFHEYFSGEGVAPHVEIGDLDRELVGVVTSSETDEEPPKYLETVAVGGSAHVDTLRNGPRR